MAERGVSVARAIGVDAAIIWPERYYDDVAGDWLAKP